MCQRPYPGRLEHFKIAYLHRRLGAVGPRTHRAYSPRNFERGGCGDPPRKHAKLNCCRAGRYFHGRTSLGWAGSGTAGTAGPDGVGLPGWPSAMSGSP